MHSFHGCNAIHLFVNLYIMYCTYEIPWVRGWYCTCVRFIGKVSRFSCAAKTTRSAIQSTVDQWISTRRAQADSKYLRSFLNSFLGRSPHITGVYRWIYQHFKPLQGDMEFLRVHRGSDVGFNDDFISFFYNRRT